jgi:hypothetical protein
VIDVCKVHYEKVKQGKVRFGAGVLRTAQVRLRDPCQLCPKKSEEREGASSKVQGARPDG